MNGRVDNRRLAAAGNHQAPAAGLLQIATNRIQPTLRNFGASVHGVRSRVDLINRQAKRCASRSANAATRAARPAADDRLPRP